MKWLKSATQKAWVVSVSGKQAIIPPNETPDNKWLRVEDHEWSEIEKQPVIASLLKAGGIVKLDEEPAELRNSVPALQVTNTQLEAENATLRARVSELEAQLKDTSGIDIEAIKAEVRQQCEAEKQKALEELDAKASQILGEKDTTIIELEKTIKKLEKKLGKETDGE